MAGGCQRKRLGGGHLGRQALHSGSGSRRAVAAGPRPRPHMCMTVSSQEGLLPSSEGPYTSASNLVLLRSRPGGSFRRKSGSGRLGTMK